MRGLECQNNYRMCILTLNSSKYLKAISRSHITFRAIAFWVKENQSQLSLTFGCLGKINQSVKSVFVTLLHQPIRVQQFLLEKKMFFFFRISNLFLENFYEKLFEFPRVTLLEK